MQREAGRVRVGERVEGGWEESSPVEWGAGGEGERVWVGEGGGGDWEE